tara:strand:- start:178 stop:402 length:225 start_codon:yes stop_codon:yes gene_type:complete
MIYKLVKWTNKKGKEVERYDRLYGKQRKEEKREQADEQKKDWDKLTLEQKWNELDKRPGECKKERARLMKGIKT